MCCNARYRPTTPHTLKRTCWLRYLFFFAALLSPEWSGALQESPTDVECPANAHPVSSGWCMCETNFGPSPNGSECVSLACPPHTALDVDTGHCDCRGDFGPETDKVASAAAAAVARTINHTNGHLTPHDACTPLPMSANGRQSSAKHMNENDKIVRELTGRRPRQLVRHSSKGMVLKHGMGLLGAMGESVSAITGGITNESQERPGEEDRASCCGSDCDDRSGADRSGIGTPRHAKVRLDQPLQDTTPLPGSVEERAAIHHYKTFLQPGGGGRLLRGGTKAWTCGRRTQQRHGSWIWLMHSVVFNTEDAGKWAFLMSYSSIHPKSWTPRTILSRLVMFAGRFDYLVPHNGAWLFVGLFVCMSCHVRPSVSQRVWVIHQSWKIDIREYEDDGKAVRLDGTSIRWGPRPAGLSDNWRRWQQTWIKNHPPPRWESVHIGVVLLLPP